MLVFESDVSLALFSSILSSSGFKFCGKSFGMFSIDGVSFFEGKRFCDVAVFFRASCSLVLRSIWHEVADFLRASCSFVLSSICWTADSSLVLFAMFGGKLGGAGILEIVSFEFWLAFGGGFRRRWLVRQGCIGFTKFPYVL